MESYLYSTSMSEITPKFLDIAQVSSLTIICKKTFFLSVTLEALESQNIFPLLNNISNKMSQLKVEWGVSRAGSRSMLQHYISSEVRRQLKPSRPTCWGKTGIKPVVRRPLMVTFTGHMETHHMLRDSREKMSVPEVGVWQADLG